MHDLSRIALILLKDASQAALRVVERPREERSNKCGPIMVVRVDGCGHHHRKQTLDSLIRAGYLRSEGDQYCLAPLGVSALRGL